MRMPTSARSAAALVAALLVGLVFSAAAQAAPGDLDPTFSGDGMQRTDFGLGDSSSKAIARQPDGKLVAVGRVLTTHGPDFGLARYNPDGSLDKSFSGNGKQTTDFAGGSDDARAVAVRGDGKIVVAGEVSAKSHTKFAIARYNSDGTLDSNFSGDGKQTTDFAGNAFATGVALQGDGKVIVVGGADGGGFALARYNPNGSLDTSFSGDGRQTTAFAGSAAASGVALQGDGKIVAVGSNVNNPTFSEDFALARYNPDGSLDPSFSGDGRQTTNFGDLEGATGVALQSDGKIVAVGVANGIGFSDFALARYNPDGSLDMSFSGDGRQTTDFGDGAAALGVALQGDGKIVAVGFEGPGGPRDDFALARYNPDGSLDTSFSGDGKQTTDSGFDAALGVTLQGDGRIVAVGHALGGHFALARYNPDGSLDTSFSGDGRQTTDFGGLDQVNAVALQANGKIVAVGGTGAPAGQRGGQGADDYFALARFKPDGSPDTSFSGDGKQTTDFGGFDDQATAVALQADGKIVAVGSGANGDFAIARYKPDGSLDTSFSGDGKQTTDFGAQDRATGVAVQSDGKIVVVGTTTEAGFSVFALARYKPDGSPDTSFSGDGMQTTNFGAQEGATGVALQGDSKIVAVGRAGGGGFALARYNLNGSLDTSFSGDGKQTTDFGGSGQANAVALEAGGKLVVVGGFGGNGLSSRAFALARYNPNGSLDTSFSGDGKQTTDFPGNDEARGVALQSDGKIVAAGFAGAADFALARYNPDGSLDTSFSGDGKQTTDFGGFDQANGVALQGDGKIVAAGVGLGADGTIDFALARYLGG
jgi:uncharacterized delta-60 repeat protein